MRFIADVMLGRLARWLRIMGYDVLYSNSYSDEELARIADQEDRCLLTRDRELLSRFRVAKSVLVDSGDLREQLRELSEKLGLVVGKDVFTRCVRCNGELQDADKRDVRDLVPEYVYATVERFSRCGGCGRIYWPGTHVQRMRTGLEEIFGGDGGAGDVG